MVQFIKSGRVCKFGDHISIDFMMPGHRVLANLGISEKDAAKFCVEVNRPGWADRDVREGDILVAG